MRLRNGLGPASRGSVLVEFALVLPILGCLVFGMLGFGQYFLLAHSIQQLANDAARATVAGLNSSERDTLARQSVAAEMGAIRDLSASRATTQVTEASGYVTVTIRYDAGNIAIFHTGLVPLPAATIERSAVARLGGGA